jgi:CTP-dependent riboflavin kinase
VNRKNKAILVKGENFEKEFESITDTIKYFGTLNIKLDRKALYLHLKDGKIYKDYYFSRK